MTLEVVPRQPACKDIVDYYLTSILIYKLIKISKHADVRNSGSTEANPQAYSLIKAMVQNFITVGYMDIQKEYIVTRVCTYLMLLHNKTYPMPSLLRDLLSWYRIACLNNNRILCVSFFLSFLFSHAQSALYNSILRVYITDRQYLTASHFLQTASFPAHVSDKQFLRFSYYKALVSTVLLNYTEAEHCLFSIHKKSGGQETGPFFEEVAKLSVLVKLLTGENPDLTIPAGNRQLAPYGELAAVVMRGDLDAYRRVVDARNSVFVRDRLERIVAR